VSMKHRLPKTEDFERWAQEDDEQEFLTLRFYIQAWSWLVPCSQGEQYTYRRVWVLEKDDGQAVGLLDSEAKAKHCNLALYIAPRHRGRGYGKDIIKTARFVLDEYVHGERSTIKATAHLDNTASRKLFCAPWQEGSPYEEDGEQWVDYVYDNSSS
jgi:RimJ/RimL family protein N-acetyltransferase